MSRTKCQVYSRVVGFITPVANWNKGKREEWRNRVEFDLEDDDLIDDSLAKSDGHTNTSQE